MKLFCKICIALFYFSSLLGFSEDKPLVIGSKNFTENRILAEIMAILIQDRTQIPVELKHSLEGTLIAFSALQQGEIDMYPEYTGTGWFVQLKLTQNVQNSLEAYSVVKVLFDEKFNITWLHPFGLSNSYALAMDEEKAQALSVFTISDLKKHEKTLTAALSHEFLSRADGYPALANSYDLHIKDMKGMDHGLAYQAIHEQKVDIIDTWTTDGKLLRYNIRVLKDDLSHFPPYHAAPIVRNDTLKRYPELQKTLNLLAFKINNETMMKLNYAVEEEGKSYRYVAAEFLHQAGLLKKSHYSLTQPTQTASQENFWKYMWQSKKRLAALTLEHLYLTLVAVLLAILLGVPLGILLTRIPTLVSPVLGVAGIIQTIPSLALLALMLPIPFLGLGIRAAIAALFLYALLPIIRNTYTGIKEVDPILLETARGIGLTNTQILRHIELPLVMRTVMAGIRTSTVISIGVATLAAFIGAGGLGEPIVTGLQLNNMIIILSGALPAATLALIVDFLLGKLETWLIPRGIQLAQESHN